MTPDEKNHAEQLCELDECRKQRDAWRACADQLRDTVVAIHSERPSNSLVAIAEHARLTALADGPKTL